MEITIRETEPQEYCSMRLVKSEDLNHHGTLFAGRTAEWVVESGFIAATALLNPRNVVCLNIHGMHFLHPVKLGEILKFTSRIAWTGKSSLTAYINVKKANEDALLVDGFLTFIHVDENTKPVPHGIRLILKTDEQKRLFEKAAGLRGGGGK
ncbi:hypothetical protein DSECCO2_552910 [anaerobic digester metagenome]